MHPRKTAGKSKAWTGMGHVWTRPTREDGEPNASQELSTSPRSYAVQMLTESSINAISSEAAKLLSAFGIGGKLRVRHVITKLNTSPKIDHQSLVLVSGPSGSGKSRTLPLLFSALPVETTTCPPPAVDEAKLIINQFTNEEQALRMLSVVGLADALIWARKPDTLSVGQRARLDLAMMLASVGEVVVIDEYLANLDRPTAKAVAWASQRALRKQGKGAIFITAHDDLLDDLQPDLHLQVGWDEEPRQTYTQTRGKPCSVLDELTLRTGDTADWNKLKPLHYAAGNPATIRDIYVAEHPHIAGPAAVVVTSYPDLHSSARNLSTDKRYQNVKDRRIAQALNREVCKISRLVVCPQLRGIGVAHWLLSEIVPRLGVQYVECVTAMGRWSGFLERVGFREIPQTTHPSEAELMDWAAGARPPAPAYLDGRHLLAFIDGLSVRGRREGRRLVWSFYHHFVLHRRTRKPAPKQVPGPDDERWREAADLAARRLEERPTYWIIGPMDDRTGYPEDLPARYDPGSVKPVSNE